MAVRRFSPAVPQTTPSFLDLGVPPALVDVLTARGIIVPSPIQAATLPDSLAGRDILGRARTGSGKTYAFALPVLARLAADATRSRPNRPRALVLVPTRELATQVNASMVRLARAMSLRTLPVFGGVRPGPQIDALRSGVDVVVACPGRLFDHVQHAHIRLDMVEITVLDEADHMADLGFLPAVRQLLDRTPRGGQRLLFSATLDAGVDVLADRYLTDPAAHSVDSDHSSAVSMSHHLLQVDSEARIPVLVNLTATPGRTLVFTRTKRGAVRLTRHLVAAGVAAVELHGDLAQGARTRNLAAFSRGRATTLVATDIAARGIHVDDVTLVIHADPPLEHKAYLHRSGRTARAGASGTVITLMTDDQVSTVIALARRAGVTATNTRVGPDDALLAEPAPGPRVFRESPAAPVAGHRPAGGRTEPTIRPPATAARRSGTAGSRNGRTGGRRRSP